MKKLANAKLIDAKTLAEMKAKCGSCKGKELADFLAGECKGKGGECTALMVVM